MLLFAVLQALVTPLLFLPELKAGKSPVSFISERLWCLWATYEIQEKNETNSSDTFYAIMNDWIRTRILLFNVFSMLKRLYVHFDYALSVCRKHNDLNKHMEKTLERCGELISIFDINSIFFNLSKLCTLDGKDFCANICLGGNMFQYYFSSRFLFTFEYLERWKLHFVKHESLISFNWRI